MHRFATALCRSSSPRASWRRRSRKSTASAGGHARKLRIEALETRSLLSAVTWINPNGGCWDVGSNWSNGQGPGAGNDAVINTVVSAPITVQSGDNISVRSVTTGDPSDTLSISGGSLTVLGGTSVLNAPLSMSGGSLIAFGSGTSLTAKDPTSIETATLEAVTGGSLTVAGPASADSASLEATGGGSLSLPTLTSYAQSQGGFTATWSAEGSGSTLSLTGLHWLGAITSWYSWTGLAVQALQGGKVSLPALATIGNVSQNVGFQADGSGSLIDLSSLPAFTPAGGSLSVTNQGTVLDPKLMSLDSVAVTLDGSGTMVTNQWTSFTNGSLTVTGGSYTSAFAGLSKIDGSSLSVQGGAYLSLPIVAGYAEPQTMRSPGVTWTAQGAGSTLSLPGLSGLGVIANPSDTLTVRALQGGRVNLSALAAIGIISSGVQFQADGSGSLIDLSALTTFDSAWSQPYFAVSASLSVTNQASVLDPRLTSLDNVAVTLDGTGTMAIGQWASLTDGSLTVTGGSYTNGNAFSGMTDIDSSSLTVQGGADVSLPAVASFAKPPAYDYCVWTAEGPGSALSLTKLSHFGTINVYYDGLRVQALQGGQVNLPALTTIGNASLGVSFQADSSGYLNGKVIDSLIDLSALTSFTPAWVQYGGSSLSVTNGATVLDANLTDMDNVAVTLDGTGTVATNQWYSLTNGSLTVTGGSYASAFAGLSDIDASNLSVQGGANVSLPLVAGFTELQVYTTVTWTAQGPGSTLSLTGLQGMGINANSASQSLTVQALQGGQVNLPALASIGSLNPAVYFQADGSGSLIDLSSLTSFTPPVPEDGPGGSLSVTNNATVLDAKLTDLANVAVTLDGTGTIAIDQWTSLTSGSMTVTGGWYTFPGLTDIDSSSLSVQNGGKLALGMVTTYNQPEEDGITWSAEGPGSTLSLPASPGAGVHLRLVFSCAGASRGRSESAGLDNHRERQQ